MGAHFQIFNAAIKNALWTRKKNKSQLHFTINETSYFTFLLLSFVYKNKCKGAIFFLSLLGAEFNGNFNLYLGEVKVIHLWVFSQCHYGLSV